MSLMTHEAQHNSHRAAPRPAVLASDRSKMQRGNSSARRGEFQSPKIHRDVIKPSRLPAWLTRAVCSAHHQKAGPVVSQGCTHAPTTGPQSRHDATGKGVLPPVHGDLLEFVNAYRGAETCTAVCQRESRKRDKSNARSCVALHECAAVISARSARPCGLTRPPKNWRSALSAARGLPHMNFRESVSLRRDHFSPSWPQSPLNECRSESNDDRPRDQRAYVPAPVLRVGALPAQAAGASGQPARFVSIRGSDSSRQSEPLGRFQKPTGAPTAARHSNSPRGTFRITARDKVVEGSRPSSHGAERVAPKGEQLTRGVPARLHFSLLAGLAERSGIGLPSRPREFDSRGPLQFSARAA